MKIYRGKLVLTDADSEIGPALIVVKDGKIIEVVKGTTEIPTSLEHVEQVHHTSIIAYAYTKKYLGTNFA